MPPKRRRYGTRSQSQSQSQLQAQTQDSTDRPDSLALLPANRGVSIATAGAVTAADIAWGAAEGLTAIADCSEITRDLGALVPIPRRGQPPPPVRGKGKAKAGHWRTATLAFACTCELKGRSEQLTAGNLAQNPRAWVSHPPELGLGSGRLEHPEWCTDLSVELDTEQDDLPEFEPLWRAPPPLAPALPPVPPPVAPAPSRLLTRLSSPADRSGRSSSLPSATQRAAPDVSARRAWWRATISADPRYGLMDTVLASEYATPYVPTAPRTDDEWKLPKRLAQQRHPFHPDVGHYLRRSGARVHWVVPVHGPVVVPGWGDPVAGGRTPFTSRGEMDAEAPAEREQEQEQSEKARPLRWTPDLLRAFVHALVALQHDGRYGRLRVAPSGPKPDPFLRGNGKGAGRVPAAHSFVPKRCRPGAEHVPPAGVECGDHVRLYVDAHKALSLRTWLNHWDGGRLARCRLALVAPSGECLIVA